MRYQTIVLELLQEEYPALHERLRVSRTLLTSLNTYAHTLGAVTRRGCTSFAGRGQAATRARSRAKPWNWRSRTCGGRLCPPNRRRATAKGRGFPWTRRWRSSTGAYADRVSAARAACSPAFLCRSLSRPAAPPAGTRRTSAAGPCGGRAASAGSRGDSPSPSVAPPGA